MELHALCVGAGPAGLSAALAFGRLRRRALVVDSGEPRNRYTDHLHNFPTRDGTAPAELRRLLRTEVESYPTVAVLDARVTGVELVERGVRVTLSSGERIDARRVVLADGVRDTLPAVDGLAEHVGVSVFTCPYCDGYEAAGTAIGLLCTPRVQLAHATGLLRMLSDDVTVYANGLPLGDEDLVAADRLGARVVASPVARIGTDEVVLVDGVRHGFGRLFVPTDVRRSTLLAEELGCAARDGFVAVDELGRTSIPRVYAAGDAASPAHQAILAAASGTRAALAANHDAIESFEVD